MSSESSLQSLDSGKNVNVLYQKTNSGGRMGRSGMPHIAQFHAVPGFTHLIDENVPSQSTGGAKSGRYVLNDVHLNLGEEMKEAKFNRRAYSGPLLFSSASGQHAEHHRTSSSILNDVPFDIHRGSHPSAVSSSSPSSPLSLGNDKATSNRSTKSKLGFSKSAVGYYSPPFLDGEVDATSVAAASAAAVRKAIEEAQAKIKFAKELMERKKEGHHNRSRPKVNHRFKSEKQEAISAEKSYKYKEEPEELHRRDDAPKRQILNCSPAQSSREVRQVTLDFRDQTKDSIARPALAVNHQVEATFTKVDSRLGEIDISRTQQEFPEAAISKGFRPSVSELNEEEQAKNVIPSSYENRWKEKMKASFLQDKFENIMKMLRAPQDVPDVEDHLKHDRNSDGLKGTVVHVGSEEKHEAACTGEEIESRSNEGTARKEDESTVKVNSWLNDIASGHKEEEDDQNGGEIEKKQSFARREDEPGNTLDEIDEGEPSKVSFDHLGIENEGQDKPAARNEEVVIEEVEEIMNGSVIGDDDPINPTSSGRESFSDSIETKRLEDDENAKVAQQPSGLLNDNVEILSALHEREESDNAEQINETHRYRELIVTVNDRATNPTSGSREIGKQPKIFEETCNFEGEEDCTRVGQTVNSTGCDGIGKENEELPEPLIVDENGVCSSGVAFKFKRHHAEDIATKSERTCCPEKHIEEATRLSGESKENADDAEVGSTDEDTARNLVSLDVEKELPNGEESRPLAELEKHVDGGATGELGDLDKDNVNHGKTVQEGKLSYDGTSKRTSQEFSESEREETAEAAIPPDERTTKNIVDDSEDAYYEALQMQETEEKQTSQMDVEMERQQPRKKEEAKEKDLGKEKERRAVERAIREARERAFTEARDKAEKLAAERAAAEANRRAKAVAAAASEKASAEAKLKAERAAVERATAEARERALEKALSEKASLKGKNYTEKSPAASNDEGRPTYQRPKSSAYYTSSRHQSSTNTGVPYPTEISGNGANGESSLKSKASMEKQQQMAERAAKALAEKNMRDLLVEKEEAEKNRLAEILDTEIKRWSSGKERNLRVLLSTLHYILRPDSGWQAIPRTDLNSATAVRKAYKKATLFVHPDKLQQRGASVRQKYVCEKVFELLKDAWNRFSAEDR
ncbi:Auxilin-like protein 1 [Linum perenne]